MSTGPKYKFQFQFQKFKTMPKQKGLIKIEGTIDGVTFYKNSEGHFVRMAGGVNKKRIMTDPAFARTRENISEFGNNAKAAKFLRDTAGIMVSRATDKRTSNRLFSIFNRIKNLDGSSPRGERRISIGLETAEGKNLLKNFDFNKDSQLRNILKREFALDTTTGVFTIAGLIPNLHISFPQGATHCSISLGSLLLDFETETGELVQSAVENFLLDTTETAVNLTATPATGTGIVCFLLLLEFFQEVNAVQYPLNNGAFNVLNILDVV